MPSGSCSVSEPWRRRCSLSTANVSSPVAEVANDRIGVRLRAAPALSLHSAEFWRTDGNSPVRAEGGGVTVFFSDYQPRGHSLRLRSDRARTIAGKSLLVRLIDDPDPGVGKWIEAVWRDPAGKLRGLSRYHGSKAGEVFGSWADTWLAPPFQHWNIEHLLPAVACPLLAVQGSADQYGSQAQLDAIERGVPGARQRVLPGCGHSPHIEQPEATLQTMADFIIALAAQAPASEAWHA